MYMTPEQAYYGLKLFKNLKIPMQIELHKTYKSIKKIS